MAAVVNVMRGWCAASRIWPERMSSSRSALRVSMEAMATSAWAAEAKTSPAMSMCPPNSVKTPRTVVIM
jgi:hypothetical protein